VRAFFRDWVMLYMGAGIFAACLFKAATPATNPLGFAYITATWPMLVICARADSGCNPMPPEWLGKYLFTFSEATP